MHKLKISFYKGTASKHGITTQMIIDEVEDLGFGATHIGTEEYDVDNLSSNRSMNGNVEKIKESVFIVKGMTCAACSGSIERYFNKNLGGIKNCSVSLLTNKAAIKYDYQTIKPRQIIEEIGDLGFEAEL